MSNYFVSSILVFHASLVTCGIHYFGDDWKHYDGKYNYLSEEKRLGTLQEVHQMFTFGYDNYMKYAFPKDELDPIHCTGRGPDYDNPSNININDVLGDYALTLVDTLDTLAIMGNSSEFKKAVSLVIENVSFDKPNTVQVFEANIRILGGLLSAHLIITDPSQPFGDMSLEDYDNELLTLAHDLAARLLPAFENTVTGIPYPRVNLQSGVPLTCTNLTCTSGAGTLLLEFGLLSRLLDDPVYENVARRSVDNLWSLRSNVTGLFGNEIHIQTGRWNGLMSGLGAGLDSFFEYLLKAFILFGDKEDLKKFNESYETIKYYMRRGRKKCNSGEGFPPIYVNVNMKSGDIINNWIDALQAAWPGVQVLVGDIEEAICVHAMYYAIWKKYGALPERYNWHLKAPDVLFYPLRPELVESTYILYQATKNPFYLHVGLEILQSLNNYTKVQCGYATIHNVTQKDLEDRMESFFLSETCKYLYLLFDHDNPLNKESVRYLFTTEGHVVPISKDLRRRSELHDSLFHEEEKGRRKTRSEVKGQADNLQTVISKEAQLHRNYSYNCGSIPAERQFFLPIKSRYLEQLESLVGIS